MLDGGRSRFQARWWEILVPLFVLVVGVTALPKPLDRAAYALLGVLLCAAAAYLALVLGRRSGVLEFFDRFRNGI
ncbi:MAG TPA: hypothetical protein VG591_07050 [Burkholderiales bacterium]|jgi:hypothetical protein|nr:hypothetical protein [Burkholderiales bacterium]